MYALPVWLHVLSWVVPALLGVWAAQRLRARYPEIGLESALPRLRHLWLVTGTAAVVVVAVYTVVRLPLAQQAALPGWLVDAAPVVLWTTLRLTIVYLCAITLRLAWLESHVQRWQLRNAAVLAMVAIELSQWQVTRPIWSSLPEGQSVDGVVLQTSDSTCAAASGATVARHLGLDADEQSMARLMRTTIIGTTTTQIVRGMRLAGIECEPVSMDAATVTSISTPMIAFINLEGVGEDGHAVAVLSATATELVVADPLRTRHLQSWEEWRSRWGGRGLVCQRSVGNRQGEGPT